MENLKNSEWLLIADGEPVATNTLFSLAKNKQVMVLDGAYDAIKKTNLSVNFLLGDFDSINSNDLLDLRKNTAINIVETPNQNKTDLEKGLEYIDHFNPHCIYIVAALGRRLQHTLYNLRLLKRYYQLTRPLILITDKEVARYYENIEIVITGQCNDSIGILGFPEAMITTQGLQYDVRDYALQFEHNNSICNALAKEQAEIKITGGVLVIHETHIDT